MLIALILSNDTSDESSVSDVLKSHFFLVGQVELVPEDRQNIVVRRRHVWQDAKRALGRVNFNECIGLNISFVGEPAVDAGGPLREFFYEIAQTKRKSLYW